MRTTDVLVAENPLRTVISDAELWNVVPVFRTEVSSPELIEALGGETPPKS